MDKHCPHLQNILRVENVRHARKVKVDISGFVTEYLSCKDKSVWFKGIKLDLVNQQISKTLSKLINIDVGAIKRANTIQANKVAKADEKKKTLEVRQALVEKTFQEERAKRIHQLMQQRQKPDNME